MPNPYARIFAAPGTKGFTVAGLIGRMPVAMTNVGIITMLAATHGSYALAGAVAATFTLSMALLTPQVSRLADRYGQRRVLPPATAVSVTSLLLMLLCVRAEAPLWLLFACAVPSGTMPNMSAMARARWTEIHRGTPRLHTAYSFESVADELTFITGPALSVLLSTMVFAQAGPLAAAAFLALGVSLFVAQRGTEPPVRAPQGATGRGARVLGAPVAVLVLTLVAAGMIVGTVDVVAVAFAEDLGAPGASGIVLSAYALGSAVSGLAFGALNPPWRAHTMLLLAVVGTALTTLPLVAVGGIAALSLVVLLSGVFFAPTMILVMTLIESVVPPARLTEGMTWALTGLTVGTALGTLAAGTAVESSGTTGGFLVAVVAGLAALGIVATGTPLLRRATATADRRGEGAASATLAAGPEEET
ncbi:MFS transporter [Nocardiopsis terrae]|uniref:MFS family permease n=1 Tax=Nocardiopsis terrae TaxID=372655 RepID=A0ABR9HJT2_9ACTN|nr:MFS transporter [Nocardiopsis terrae]MBE1459269.1 MFS family permease [Nocardiopsis terrae]GHC89038.1 MFS transporter [Nocardiopsis terrae]